MKVYNSKSKLRNREYWIIIWAHGKSVFSFCKCCMNRKKLGTHPEWSIDLAVLLLSNTLNRGSFGKYFIFLWKEYCVSGEFWIYIPNLSTSWLSWHNFWEQPLSLWKVSCLNDKLCSRLTDIDCVNSCAWLLLWYRLGEDNSKPGEGGTPKKVLAVLKNFWE